MFQLTTDNTYGVNRTSNLKYVELNDTYYNTDLIQALQTETFANTQNSSSWGPKRDPLYIVIPITILYAIIFFSGVVGNVSTCIVIARNKCMHTATNYYLFSLAISDLLLLVSGLPPEICQIWSKYPYIFGEAFCVVQGFAAETSANATVLTITAFTVERYVAICHPFLSHTMSKLSRAIKFVIGVWILALCLAIPQAISFGIVYERSPDGRMMNDEHYVCNVKRIVIPHTFAISTLVFFVAPMSMITVLYILIGVQLHRSTVSSSRCNSVKLKHRVCRPTITHTNISTQAVLVMNGDNIEGVQHNRPEDEGRKNFARNSQATKHVVKMLVAVVVAFFICWAPFHAQRLLATYGQPTTAKMVTAFGVLTYTSGILYYLSTTVNPLLYHIMSHRFREAFKDTFNSFFRRGKGIPKGKCYSTLSGRSSQINSQSNTDSCSRQSSLRYLDTEMARLHNSRRPLIVSFRRKKQQLPKCSKQVVFDADLREALDKMKHQPSRKSPYNVRSNLNLNNENNKHSSNATNYDTTTLSNECLFPDKHKLEPKHICPLDRKHIPFLVQESTKLVDIEIFHEQCLKIHKIKRDLNGKVMDNELKYSQTVLTKSNTMPQMMYAYSDGKNDNLTYDVKARKMQYGKTMNICIENESERSNSCYQLEFVENSDDSIKCGHSETMMIQVS